MAWFRRLLVISGALSLCLLLLNLQTKGRCYIQPCEQGSGLADLFTVHFGLSFQGISAAAALLAHALYGWAVAARKNNMYRVGLMVGVSVTATLLAAQTTVLWASQVYLMKGMHRHRVFRESGRVSFDSAALELGITQRFSPTISRPLFARCAPSFFLRRSFAVSSFLAPRRRERAKNGVKWAKFGGETAEKQR